MADVYQPEEADVAQEPNAGQSKSSGNGDYIRTRPATYMGRHRYSVPPVRGILK